MHLLFSYIIQVQSLDFNPAPYALILIQLRFVLDLVYHAIIF